MITCGVKVSHDGAVAVIDGNRLLFSVEMEKRQNGLRHAALGDLARIDDILADHGLSRADVDRFVVDGWWDEANSDIVWITTANHGERLALPVAPYIEQGWGPRQPKPLRFDPVPGSALERGYTSVAHATQHLLGGYCTSPFAQRREPALCLVWDGGMLPRLYRVRPEPFTVEFLEPIFGLLGDTFTYFCMELEPFYRDRQEMDEAAFVQHHLQVAGKAMAYAGLGSVDEDAVRLMDKMVAELGAEFLDPTIGSKLAHRRGELFPGLSSADLIADFQEYIGRLLVSALADAVAGLDLDAPPALCITGGCALNIKWNNMIRSSGVFSEVWIPPFPNDAGAAIGAASSELVLAGGDLALNWNAYAGPAVLPSEPMPGWSASACDERELAALLHRTGEAVVVIDGNAELGPRALGNRSIIAAATDPRMKDELNRMKHRADYRPVAPICLESAAPDVFDPGNADPYMLFDHKVRSEWVDRVPAILHLDGTARLQTITADTPGTRIGRVLERYAELSGIPLLCNTSANMSGHGFFPDVRTATEWGRTRFVWSDRVLYSNPERHSDD